MFGTRRKVSLLLSLCFALPALARTEPFILGADISWIPQREASNVRYADNGTVKDIFDILKEHRFNWIRLRLFVDPTATVPGESESPYSRQGFCNLEYTRAMALRIKNAGMKFLLDFHYSDTWADPGKQHKPVSWNDLTFSQLTERVRSYTRETLQAFQSDGTLPDMVQVGNEIVGGMIWPDGRSSTMRNFAALVNAGIDGVKDVDQNIKIMIHSISENSPNNWLRNLVNAGVNRIDVFGLSYYSEWHGTPDELQQRVQAVVANHTVKVVIAEYADNHRRVNDIIFNLPNEQGLGTFVWEPADWKEALFDWRNGRRETNNRIDLYPIMSQEYGNDAIVAAEKQHFPLIPESPEAPHITYYPGGTVQYRSSSHNPTTLSLVTLQGRLTQQWRIVSPGTYTLHTPTTRSNRYLLIIDSKGICRQVVKTGGTQ